MTGIPLVPLEAPTDNVQRMEQWLYRILRTPRSLRPSWILLLRMIVAYSPSCADFAFHGCRYICSVGVTDPASAETGGCSCPVPAAPHP